MGNLLNGQSQAVRVAIVDMKTYLLYHQAADQIEVLTAFHRLGRSYPRVATVCKELQGSRV
jgi:hypothetical protein